MNAINPKDSQARDKLPLDLVPSSLAAWAALAFAEGAAKYGAYNWRVAGVSASVYRAALERHVMSWWNGEDADPETGVPHLASMAACIGILIDADLCGKLADDRPPAMPMGEHVRAAEHAVRHTRALFADRQPLHWTERLAAAGVTPSESPVHQSDVPLPEASAPPA